MKTVAILGLGYVGLPLAQLLTKSSKYRVIGLDISPHAIHRAQKNTPSTRFTATNDFAKISEADISVICVPTPVLKNFQPDYTPLKNAALSVAKNLKKGQLVIVESTVNPGTCEEVVMPILERFGAVAGKDFLLAHCPERIDPGNQKWTLINIPRNVGGWDEKSTKSAAQFYRSFLRSEVKVLSNLKAAEATKIIENTFRDINIAYVNELAMSFDVLGIDLLEVIEGAETKPFAFMPHYPGVGVGGHCFEKNQIVFLKTMRGLETVTMKELYERIYNTSTSDNSLWEVLSFDLEKQEACFKKVILMTKRPSESVLRFQTKYGYELKVTDLHPVVVFRGEEMITCLAKNIKPGDLFVINRHIPILKNTYMINSIEAVKNQPWHSKIRVAPTKMSLLKWKNELSSMLANNPRAADTYFRYNFLPLLLYIQAKQANKISTPGGGIVLRTGRGPSTSSFPATLAVDSDLCRLIGYYLSEGCLTKDDSSRVRFTFHRQEHEYLRDVRNILRKKSISFSEYHSKQWQSSTIKVSSQIFGEIIQNVLACGTNCYTMSVPPQLLALPRTWRKEAIKGLVRGDGGVEMREGKRFYKKRGKTYFHENNSGSVNYFSSSKKLFQQVISLLLDQGIFPKIQKREGLLRISGQEDLKRMNDYFDGDKQISMERMLRNRKKIIQRDTHLRHKNFLLSPVTSIETLPTDIVYSLEVEDTHTVVTSFGIVAHNCIPVDPYYLIERALHSGFEHRFLSAAREVNNGMPAYTVGLLEKELKKLGRSLSSVTVGVLGLAYKKDVDDMRESPALKVIQVLKSKKAKVLKFDPFLPKLSDTKTMQELFEKCPAIILATNHSAFQKIKPAELKKAGVEIIIDGRNCLPKKEILACGMAYKGIGH